MCQTPPRKTRLFEERERLFCLLYPTGGGQLSAECLSLRHDCPRVSPSIFPGQSKFLARPSDKMLGVFVGAAVSPPFFLLCVCFKCVLKKRSNVTFDFATSGQVSE